MQTTESPRIGSFTRPDGKRQHVRQLLEDEEILVIDKPAGLLSLPDRYDATIPHVKSVVHGGEFLIVHRLDRDTSGVMVLAKTAAAHANLNSQFEARTVEKTYVALVVGRPNEDAFTIDKPLMVGSGPGHRTIVDSHGKPARTDVRILERFRGFALVEACPRTGRTHQIRAHLAFAGFPVVADRLYGDGKALLLSSFKPRYSGDEDERPLVGRHALHASSITFVHPASMTTTTVVSPLAKDMRASVNQLGKWARR